MPFVRQKIDPESLPWVTSIGRNFLHVYRGDWAIDTERDAVFFFQGADCLDSSLPRTYRLKVGTEVFRIDILDSQDSRDLRDATNRPGGIAKILIREGSGAVTPRDELMQLCIEAYRCLHGTRTENFERVSSL